MYTLVVVDMQAGFQAARNLKVQEHCKRAIAKAVKNKAAIVFLEFKGQGHTLPNLTKLVRNYPKAFFTRKEEWDGSMESLRVLRQNNIEHSKFKVCGVYTDCCVNATAVGLIERTQRKSKVEVISSACWATDETYHQDGLKYMRQKGVRLLK